MGFCGFSAVYTKARLKLDINNNINLNFEGPFGLAGDNDKILFQEPISKKCGIYLWATPYIEGGFLINYIGETGVSFWQRMKDHMIQTMGGNYRLCDPDALLKGEERILWNGLWRKGTRDKMVEYLDNLVKLAPAIQKTFQITNIFVAPFEAERRIRQRVEGALAVYIKEQPPPASSLLPRDIRFYYRGNEESPISVSLRCSANIHGLPNQLTA